MLSLSLASSASPLPAASYANPVFPSDFPDPHVVLADSAWYAFATNTGTQNVPVLWSTDLAHWARMGDALPALPHWAAPKFGDTWAPGVIEVDGAWLLYVVSRDAVSKRQCIGVAVGERPEGPYRDDATVPLVCQDDLGGSIDPYPWRDDDGRLYLYWKNNGNCCAKPVALWGQALSPDGRILVGEAVELLQRDQSWEVPLIENPAMLRAGERYHLFYSGNWWSSHEYAVGHAECESPLGPCSKPRDEPVFRFTPDVMGPGGQSFFMDMQGGIWMAYHAWTGPEVGYPRGARSLRIEPVVVADGEVIIEGPTTGPRPVR